MVYLDISTAAPHIEVKPTETGAGFGIFSTRSLSMGDAVIAIEQPLFAALDIDRLHDTCYECYRGVGDIPIELQLGFPEPCPLVRKQSDAEEVTLSRCTGCRTVRYCSKVCQKASWAAHHSLECKLFKMLFPRELPSQVRAVIRVLLLKKAGKLRDEDWNSFMTCTAHAEDVSKKNKETELAVLKDMAKMINTYTLSESELGEELVLAILMRLKINGLTLQTPFHDPLGLVLHPLLAKANHSCNPNCYVRFPGPNSLRRGTVGANAGSIILTPLRKLEKGEEITISYIEETMPIRYRRSELEDRYFFTCPCRSCIIDAEDDARFSDVRGAKHKLQDQAKIVLNVSESKGLLSSLEDQAVTVAANIRALFANNSNWPLTLYPFPQLLHKLILLHIDAQKFSTALRLTALLCYKVDPALYVSPIYPLRLTHILLLLRLVGALVDVPFQGDNTEADRGTMQLRGEIDLHQWIADQTQDFVNLAATTWREQPWPWMRDVCAQNKLPHDHGLQREVAMAKQARNKETLCTQTLESLKRG